MRRLTRCHDARLTTSAAVLSFHTRGTPWAVRVDAARRHSLSSRPSLPPLAIGDRISLDRADVDISAHLGGTVVEHGFDVKSTARSIVYIDECGTRRRQEIIT